MVMSRHRPRCRRGRLTAARHARRIAPVALAVAATLACSEHKVPPYPVTPPAEQTHLATVVRLFGEGRPGAGRPVDYPTYWPLSDGTLAGDSLAYTAKLHDGRFHVYVADLTGRGRHAVTSVAGSNSNPSWDPTGSWVAYASIRTGSWDIWRTHIADSRDEPITDDDFEDQDPAVSPDGMSIAFASRRDTVVQPVTFDIWLLDLGGGDPTQLTRSRGDDRHPSWSPDGRSLVYHRAVADSTASLHVIVVDSGRGRRLTDAGGAFDMDPAWSPDGQYVAFASTRGGSWDLWIVAADGSDPIPRPLTDSPWNDRRPAWSRHADATDANLIFVSNRGTDEAIWRALRLLR
jgi:Tol biopolymer transport system component